MTTHKLKSFIFLSLLIVLSSCSNSSEEFNTYFNVAYPELEDEATQAGNSTIEYEELILDLKPDEVIEILNNKVIPEYETLLKEIENMNITETNLIRFNNAYQDSIQIDLEKQLANKSIFEEITVYYEDYKLDEFDVDQASEKMDELYEEAKKINDKLSALTDELVKNNDSLEIAKPDEVNVTQMKEKDYQLMVKFSEGIDK